MFAACGASSGMFLSTLPDMLRCRPSSSIPAEEFLPLRSRIAPNSLPGASQSAGGIRSTPQVSWLVSGINTPEGSCAVEEFCCNEFAAALPMPDRWFWEDVCLDCINHVLSACGVCCSPDSHLQVMFFKVLENCLKLSCGIIVAALR